MQRHSGDDAPVAIPLPSSTAWRSFLVVGWATAIVRVVALARELVVANNYGVSSTLDAFVIALLVPTFVAAVLADSLSAVVVPIYAKRLRLDDGTASEFIASATALAGACLLACSVALAALAPLIVRLVAPSFTTGQASLTVRLIWVLLPLIAVSGFASVWTGALSVRGRFLIPAVSPVLIPICALGAIQLGDGHFGILALAGGTTAGYVLQLVPLARLMRQEQIPVSPRRPQMTPELRLAIGQYIPLAVGSAVSSMSLLVDQAVASRLGSGSVSTLYYSNRLINLITSVAGIALGTAVLPHFARVAAGEDWQQFRRTLAKWSWGAVAVTSFLAALLVIATPLLVDVLLLRGKFDRSAADTVARVQRLYLLQLPAYALGVLYARVLSSLHRNRTLLYIAIVNLFLNVALDLLLSHFFGISGIALATVAVLYSASALGLLSIRRTLRDLERPRSSGLR